MTIHDVMKKYINVVIDKDYYNKINKIRVEWINKSEEYTKFLGSNLTGTQTIRFSEYDEDKLFIEMLNVDRNTLESELHNLKEVKKERNVSSDVYYLTSIYMIYLTSIARIPQDLKDKIIEEHYYLMSYKIMGSLYSHYFKFPVDVGLAKSTYEKMSNHFIIKTEGSWAKVLEYRAKNDILPHGLWYKRLSKMDTLMATKIVADLQGRLREILKFIYKIMMEVKEVNEKIGTTTLVDSSDEDGDGIKDLGNRSDMYITYLNSIFNRPNEFVNDDLVHLVSSFNKNVNNDHLTKALKYMSETIEIKEGTFNILETVLLSTFDYINKKGINHDYHKQLGNIMVYMKGVWSSSSTKDEDIKKSKEFLGKIVKQSTGVKTPWYIATIVITMGMYIFARSLFRNQY